MILKQAFAARRKKLHEHQIQQQTHDNDVGDANGRAGSAEQLDREFAFLVAGHKHSEECTHQELLQKIDHRRGVGDIESLSQSVVPSSKNAVIRRAQQWYDDDDLLSDLVYIKSLFAILGMSMQCKPHVDTPNDNIDINNLAGTQQFVNDVANTVEFEDIVYELLEDWFVTDNCILHWKIDESIGSIVNENTKPQETNELIPGLQYVCTLDPADVDWKNSLGVDRLWIRVPHELQVRIEVALQAKSPEKELLLQELRDEGISQKWIDAVAKPGAPTLISHANRFHNNCNGNHAPMVELKNEDGEYWIIKTKNRNFRGLAKPRMKSIFMTLETRRMLNDGEFAIAFMMKHFIQHITLGESIDQGPLAGQTNNWAGEKDTQAILSKFTNAQKSMRMATNHTVKINYVFPPPEMFDQAKFEHSDTKIFRWAGVIVGIAGGEGDQTTAEIFVGIKRLLADIARARRKTSEMIFQFFNHHSIRERIGGSLPDNCDVIIQYDENVLKDPALLLNEIRFLIQEGIGDPEVALRELGRDPDALKLSKARSRAVNEATQVFEPIWDRFGQQGFRPDDGRQGGQEGGRPNRPDIQSNELTRFQNPVNQGNPETI